MGVPGGHDARQIFGRFDLGSPGVEYPQVPGLDQRVERASGLFFLCACWFRRVEEGPSGIDDRDPPGRSDQPTRSIARQMVECPLS
jgi:hypothetical protein